MKSRLVLALLSFALHAKDVLATGGEQQQRQQERRLKKGKKQYYGSSPVQEDSLPYRGSKYSKKSKKTKKYYTDPSYVMNKFNEVSSKSAKKSIFGKGKGKGIPSGGEGSTGKKGSSYDDNNGGDNGGSNGDDDNGQEPGGSSDDNTGGNLVGCKNAIALAIDSAVAGVVTRNPEECCNYVGPVGVYATHAELSSFTRSGLDNFWDLIYEEVTRTSRKEGVCFVFTGFDSASERVSSEVIADVAVFASSLAETTAIMVTDPSDDAQLMNEVRFVLNDPSLPSIGIFNSGYNNLVIESLVSGQDRIPFIGFTSDGDFGIEAAKYALDLLGGIPARPVCFNGRPDLSFVGERCSSFYTAMTTEMITPMFGATCSSTSSVQDILNVLVESEANVVYSHIDCCAAVAQAVKQARDLGQVILAVGCQDDDTSGDGVPVDFVTAQPIELQAYTAATWMNLPVRKAIAGEDGRARKHFPSVASFVNTAIFTESI